MSDGYGGRATFLRRHLLIVAFLMVWAFLALHVMALSQIADTADWPAERTARALATINVIMVFSLVLPAEWLRTQWRRRDWELGGVLLGVWIFGLFAVYFYEMVDYGHGGPAAALAVVLCGVYLTMLVRHWDIRARAKGLLNSLVSDR